MKRGLTIAKIMEQADAAMSSEEEIIQKYELDRRDRDDLVALFIITVQRYEREVERACGFQDFWIESYELATGMREEEE